jgi:hypothetical protein
MPRAAGHHRSEKMLRAYGIDQMSRRYPVRPEPVEGRPMSGNGVRIRALRQAQGERVAKGERARTGAALAQWRKPNPHRLNRNIRSLMPNELPGYFRVSPLVTDGHRQKMFHIAIMDFRSLC